jgi:hypothetical protein
MALNGLVPLNLRDKNKNRAFNYPPDKFLCFFSPIPKGLTADMLLLFSLFSLDAIFS